MKNLKFSITLAFLFCFFILRSIHAQTTLDKSIVSGGLTRTYRLYIPAAYSSTTAVPLLFNLHGYGSNNIEQESYGDFRPIADTANFIIVHPNGTIDGSGARFWNTFGFSTVDDIGFISALIDTISANYNINSKRIYSTGMSNGGFMSYELACRLSSRIAAVASVTGTLTYAQKSACTPSHPTPVMQIHGTADATVPYNGNTSFVPIDTLVKYWVEYNNCSLTPVITAVPNTNTTDGCTAEHHVYSGGDSSSTVEFYKIIGGGHSWPGAPVNINTTNRDFSASTEIWRFFSKYDIDMLTNISTKNNKEEPVLDVYPNPFQNSFYIRFNNASLRRISIINSLGILVKEIECNAQETNLNLDAKGVYFIIITENDKIQTRKLINQ